ncbi:MAG: cobalamin biosynthesis protein CbiX [Verrucomicrobiota bacterium]|nr:cobalamin biosynthesis protein CbiX [Verrucomicrobiota bacterium]
MALLIVGHGSTVNAESSAPTWAHARAIRRRGLFAQVKCAFWKEEPSLRDARFLFQDAEVRDVFVVPNFISEGYFTQTIIPRELELDSAITARSDGQRWHYCEPVGNHPLVTDLLLKRAREIAPGIDEKKTALLIVGHGTALNDNSALAAKREAERIRARSHFAAVLNAYMEEPPLIADWDKLTDAENVIVVPFFIADGLHSYEDIPVLLGLRPENSSTVFGQNPHRLRGRTLFYASSIGTEAQFADAIVEQALNARSVTDAR